MYLHDFIHFILTTKPFLVWFGENEQNLGEETKSPAKMGIIK